jgi:voltage-gated potassium channel
VLVVMLESEESISGGHEKSFLRAEIIFTALFTLEYIARIVCARRPWRYVFSFFGVIDLLAILPLYLMAIMKFAGVELDGAQSLTVIRSLRLLRAFRIFKLAHMLSEATALQHAMWAARAKVAVFLAFVVIAVVIVGSAMYVIEGFYETEESPSNFTSIPQSMYWAIVTMTTVGYGDVSPATAIGKALAAGMMILGYCMIIVPTGIVSAELAHAGARQITTQVCPECMSEGHDADAVHCKFCGSRL